jgi:hypothetical protein
MKMQLDGLGGLRGLGSNTGYNFEVQMAARARVAAAARTTALLNAQKDALYQQTLSAYISASQAEAQALLNVAAANSGTNQSAINKAVQVALLNENNALMAYAEMEAAGQQSPILQAALLAQSNAAAYAAAKAALLPSGGWWNTQSWQPQYVIDAPTYAALVSGYVIYNWYGASAVMLGRPVLCFCNGYFRANPKATLAQINNYGGQLSAAAAQSNSFGSFLLGALPYIALVVVIAAVIVSAGSLAAPGASAASALTTGASGLAVDATAAGLAPLSATELAATAAADATAAGLAPLSAAELAATAAANTGGGALLTTTAGGGLATGGGGILQTVGSGVASAGAKIVQSLATSKLSSALINHSSPASQLTTAPIASPPAPAPTISPTVILAMMGLAFTLLK